MKTYMLFLAVLLSGCVSPPTAQDRRDEMLYPVARVSLMEDVSTSVHPNWATRAYGSAVTIYSDDITVLLTAEHLTATGYKMFVQFIDDPMLYPARLLKADEGRDLAMIVVETTNRPIAKLSFEPVERFEKVWAVGAGLGTPMLATFGYSGLTNQGRMMFSASVVGGDSGGAVFTEKDGHYVVSGIVSQVSLTHPVSPFVDFETYIEVPVYHRGIAVSSDAIQEFVNE